jgi:hypothetical protein
MQGLQSLTTRRAGKYQPNKQYINTYVNMDVLGTAYLYCLPYVGIRTHNDGALTPQFQGAGLEVHARLVPHTTANCSAPCESHLGR